MSFAATDPCTASLLYELPAHNETERECVIARVHADQRRWCQCTIAERAPFVSALGEALRRHRESLALVLAVEMGKPLASGRAEVDKCAALCLHAPVMAAQALATATLVDDVTCLVTLRYDALGTVLAIMPWNFPYWQALRFAVPALLAGNGVLIKPATSVPGSATWLARCFDEARTESASLGVPPAPCDVALFEIDVLEQVIADARIVGVTLTGSDRAGRHVAQVAGAHLKKVVLELGGSDPFLLLPDADVERAAAVAVAARTVNSGQSCIAAKRFIVCVQVYDEFVERLVLGMSALTMGDPRDERTQIGPIATASVRDELARQVRASITLGARPLVGGDNTDLPGFFYPPTVLVDIPADAPAAREELFGPVAAVFRVANEAEAIRLANASAFGLGASVWTSDAAVAERCIAQLDAGMVFVNDMVVSDLRYPFGGIKQSGMGRELGHVGFREFTNLKLARILHPPARLL